MAGLFHSRHHSIVLQFMKVCKESSLLDEKHVRTSDIDIIFSRWGRRLVLASLIYIACRQDNLTLSMKQMLASKTAKIHACIEKQGEAEMPYAACTGERAGVWHHGPACQRRRWT
eukprot:1161647-Pelagomonas_calceolata.AAC.5